MLGISGILAAIAAVAIGGGALSLGPQQYGEVNILYVPGIPSSEPGYLPPNPCVVDIAIFNGQGNEVKFKEASLVPGQTATLTFDADDLNGNGRGYAQRGSNLGIFTEQATVVDTCGSNTTSCDASLCPVNQAVEIIDDATGVTRVLVDGGLLQALAD